MLALARRSLVGPLGFRIGPSTVARLIVTFVVDAIQCGANGSWSHIRHEVLERRPSFTHIDAATTVVGEPLRLRVRATLAHAEPRTVLTSSPSSAFGSTVLTNRDESIAPATCTYSAPQRVPGHKSHNTAITATNPPGMSSSRVVIGTSSNDLPSAKATTRQVQQCSHMLLSIVLEGE